MSEKREDNTLPKYFDPSWIRSKIMAYREKYGQKILVFLFFVFLSSIIWFFSALGKNYVTSITFPVRYRNFPPEKVLVNELPTKLSLRIQSVGSKILSYKLKIGIRPVTFDVSSFLKGNTNNSTEFYLLTSTTQDEIQDQLPTNIQVVDIEPDTIYFSLANMVDKKVKVKPSLNISFKQQFMQKGDVMIIPDSIIISGAEVIVDTVDFIETENLTLKDIDDTIKTELDLIRKKGLNYSSREVDLKIYAEKYTEAEIIVPIQVENMPDSLEMKIFPKSATIKYNVGLSDFNKIYPEKFRISLDYQDAIQNLNRKVNISLLEYPNYINNVNFFPKTVEFIIEK